MPPGMHAPLGMHTPQAHTHTPRHTHPRAHTHTLGIHTPQHACMPPWACTSTPRRYCEARSMSILLECILVFTMYFKEYIMTNWWCTVLVYFLFFFSLNCPNGECYIWLIQTSNQIPNRKDGGSQMASYNLGKLKIIYNQSVTISTSNHQMIYFLFFSSKHKIVTIRQRSCGKVMFSQVCVCLSTGGRVTMWPLPMMYWTSLYRSPGHGTS